MDKCQYIPNDYVPVHSEQWRATVPENTPYEESTMSKQIVPPSVVARWSQQSANTRRSVPRHVALA